MTSFSIIVTARPIADVSRDLGPQAAVLYAELCRACNEGGQARVMTSERQLADVLGCRPEAVRSTKYLLERHGLIEPAGEGALFVCGWPRSAEDHEHAAKVRPRTPSITHDHQVKQ